MRARWLGWLTLAGVLSAPVLAQDEDGPGRGVARLSVINGDVSVKRGDSGDWVAGAVNAPLVVEDRVMTGHSSRAEVQFDWANFLRLSSNTEVRLSELEHGRYQAQLLHGTVMLRVLRDTDAEIEVSTPSVSIRPLHRGAFRITVTDEGQVEITTRSGEAEIYTPTGVERLRAGRTMLVRGTPSNPEFRTIDAVTRDSFDSWSENRDRYLERSGAYRYVSRDIYGADELDYYGRWVWIAPYGWVWTPWGVAAWWAPYRHGRWVWIDWYGWTWLSYDPWGWAPFHYGRWFWHPPYGWCWYPGPIRHRHYWRPALVAFFGFHVGGLHVGLGFGRIGWVPLAPFEPFHPWYGPRHYRALRNPVYIDNSVRIVNNVEIVNIYRNARVAGGVSAIDHDGFARGRRPEPISVQEGTLRRASLIQGPLPVPPASESVRFSDVPVRTKSPLPRTETERFFSRRPAAPVERVPFELQRNGMERLARRVLGAAPEPSIAGDVSRQAAALPAPGQTNLPRTQVEARGWRQVGESRDQSGDSQQAGWRRLGEARNLPRTADERGWRRIGEPTRAEQTPQAEREQRSAGWRWIGQTDRTEPRGMPRNEGADASHWRRFGEPRTFGAEPGTVQERRADREQAPPWRSAPSRSESWREQPGRAQPIFINPPIVRERTTPRFESGPRMRDPGIRGSEARAEGGSLRGGEARSGSRAGAEAGTRGGGRTGRLR